MPNESGNQIWFQYCLLTTYGFDQVERWIQQNSEEYHITLNGTIVNL